jgi:hypothetical protein
VITGSSASIKEVANIVLLSIALALIPTFAFWMHRQEKLNRPAIIPNSIWKQSAFTCTCLAVFLTWGAFNPFGYFSTLLYVPLKLLFHQLLYFLTTFQFPRDPIPLSPPNLSSLPTYRRLRCHNQHPNRPPGPKNFRFLSCSGQLAVLLHCMSPHGTRKPSMDFLGCCFPSDIFESNVF